MKNGKILNALTSVALCTSVLTAESQTQPSPFDLGERQVKRINLNQVTIVNATTRALNAARAPGGIATVSACGSEGTYNLTPAGQRLRDVLDSIVIADPRYRWSVDHGVVNLTQFHDERTLLDVVLPSFNVERGKTMDEIVQGLLNAPEIEKASIQLQLKEGGVEIGLRSLERPGFPKAEDHAFEIHLKNVTLRGALNAIARAHGSAVWRYDERECESPREFSIKFLVW